MNKFFLFYFISNAMLFGQLSCASIPQQSMPEEGSPGLDLVRKKCTVCHGLPHPRRHTASEWGHILGLMAERMKEKLISLKPIEMEQIKLYLQRNSR